MRKAMVLKTVLMAGAGVGIALGAAGLALAKAPKAEAPHQVVTGPVAEYWVSTTTSTGLSLAGMSGGGRPSMGSIMDMMKGGVSHTMRLQLGSSQPAAGEANADHLPPTVLNAGNDLPLYYKAPVTQKSQPSSYQASDDKPQQSEPPKGKILIFWGCGEHAPKDQPVVIDLSKLADSSARIAMMSKMMPQPITLDTVHPPSPDRWKSYGEWPNEKSRTGLDANSSLLGAHVVKGNYSPEINFNLMQTQDFLAPIQLTGNTRDAAGAVPLQWQALPGARGFIASVMGAGGKDADGGAIIVVWTSAQSQMGWTGLAADYLTPHDEERLVASKTLLPGDATSCTVPAEVASPAGAGQGGGLMYSMTAFGGETNIAYPPRPEDPKTPWNIQWETKVRYKSTTGGMLGRTMGGGGFGAMGGDGGSSSGSSSSSAPDAPKKKKGSLFGDMVKQGLGSMIPGGGG